MRLEERNATDGPVQCNQKTLNKVSSCMNNRLDDLAPAEPSEHRLCPSGHCMSCRGSIRDSNPSPEPYETWESQMRSLGCFSSLPASQRNLPWAIASAGFRPSNCGRGSMCNSNIHRSAVRRINASLNMQAHPCDQQGVMFVTEKLAVAWTTARYGAALPDC